MGPLDRQTLDKKNMTTTQGFIHVNSVHSTEYFCHNWLDLYIKYGYKKSPLTPTFEHLCMKHISLKLRETHIQIISVCDSVWSFVACVCFYSVSNTCNNTPLNINKMLHFNTNYTSSSTKYANNAAVTLAWSTALNAKSGWGQE